MRQRSRLARFLSAAQRTPPRILPGRSPAFVAAAMCASALALAMPRAAQAQTCSVEWSGQCTATTSATLTVPAVIQVLVSPAAPVPPATLAEFEAGHGDIGGPTITVSANTPWALGISAAAATWTATNTAPNVAARTDKPAGDLLWSADGASFTPLDLTSHELATGSATSAFVLTLSYRVLYSLLLDTPGRYEMTVLLTVTAP